MFDMVTNLISERKIPALDELQMEALLHIGNGTRWLPRRNAACRTSVPFSVSGGNRKSQLARPLLGAASTAQL